MCILELKSGRNERNVRLKRFFFYQKHPLSGRTRVENIFYSISLTVIIYFVRFDRRTICRTDSENNAVRFIRVNFDFLLRKSSFLNNSR